MPSPKKSQIGRKTRAAVRQSQNVKKKKMDPLNAFQYNPEEEYNQLVNVGSPTVKCAHCFATRWPEEPQGFCCLNGKVVLPALPQVPEVLNNLLHKQDKRSGSFLNNIRAYNNALAMTSIGCNEIREGNFMPTFKISGGLYHQIGSVLPSPDSTAKFLQIYFVGSENVEAELRCSYSRTKDTELMKDLQSMLYLNNKCVRELKSTKQLIIMFSFLIQFYGV